MHYKSVFRRVRPSTICPGLVPPFGPPRHPSFPSGHSFLGHFIALLLLEIDPVAARFGEPNSAGTQRTRTTLGTVMSSQRFKGPLLWLGHRLAKGRERAGLHYPSDSRASRWLAGVMWALLTSTSTVAVPQPGGGTQAFTPIDCPTLHKVLRMAKAEW
jgi:hypothetical protein